MTHRKLPPPVIAKEPAGWHGITWRDVPGHDPETQKFNFSLLKRNQLHGYKSCFHLHDDALRERLKSCSLSNRNNAQKAAAASKVKYEAAKALKASTVT